MYKCRDIIPNGCERTFKSEVSLNGHLLGDHFIFRPLCGTGINEKKHITKQDLEMNIKEQVQRLKEENYKPEADRIANIINNLIMRWKQEGFIIARPIYLDIYDHDLIYSWYPFLFNIIQ